MIGNAARRVYYHLPEDFRQGVLVLRRTRIWIRAGILFIHIPKVAGASINTALYGRLMGHPSASDVERWGSSKLKLLPSFAVARNPWDRLVSAYRFARRGCGVGGPHQAGVWRPEQYQCPEFEFFDRFVKEWLAPKDVNRLDPIFRPQSLFVSDAKGNQLVDHVGRLEDLEPTLDFIAVTLGRRPNIPRSNRSGGRVDYRDFYTPELADIVGEKYADDIRTFHYDFG